MIRRIPLFPRIPLQWPRRPVRSFLLHAIPFLAASLLSAVLLSACASSRPPVVADRVRTDTLYISTHFRDSVFVLDSTHVRELRTTDTVRITLDHYRTIYRDRVLRDTLWRTRTDTITKIVQIPAPRTSLWQRLKLDMAGLVLIGVLVVGLFIRLKK